MRGPYFSETRSGPKCCVRAREKHFRPKFTFPGKSESPYKTELPRKKGPKKISAPQKRPPKVRCPAKKAPKNGGLFCGAAKWGPFLRGPYFTKKPPGGLFCGTPFILKRTSGPNSFLNIYIEPQLFLSEN